MAGVQRSLISFWVSLPLPRNPPRLQVAQQAASSKICSAAHSGKSGMDDLHEVFCSSVHTDFFGFAM
jgi:hypothetical protein